MTAPANRRGQPVSPDAQAREFSRFLKGFHLDGKPLTVTIHSFTREETHPSGESVTALVMHLVENLPPVVISPTNRDTLTHLFGNRIGDWMGKQIELYPHSLRVGKVEKTPIRIRAITPAKATTPAPAPDKRDGAGSTPATAPEQAIASPVGAGSPRPEPTTATPTTNGNSAHHPGHKEFKAACDARNLTQARRNELLRTNGGSYEDAIAELAGQAVGK